MTDRDLYKAPLIEHLIELRSRLLRSIVVVLVVFFSLYAFSNSIYAFVAEPLMRIMPAGTTMIATDVTSPFLAPFKLTFMVALFITVPFLLYQAWAFIAPGLYSHEKRLAIPLLLSSVLLFYAGMAFAYYVVFPLLFHFFTTAAPQNVKVMTDINAYLSFVMKLFMAFGLAFEVPVATVLLVLTGAVSVETLTKKRGYVVIGCFVIGMLFTPPDIMSQCLLAFPMWLLFEAGLLCSRLIKQPRGGRARSDEPEHGDERSGP